MIRQNRPNTPQDSARAERLDVLAGTRGRDGAKAVRKDEFVAAVAEAWPAVAGERIFQRSAVLGADVSLTVSNQWYDGPSIGLDPGIYMVMAQAQVRNEAAAGATVIAARIFDGDAAISAGQAQIAAASGEGLVLTLLCPLVVTKAKAVTLQLRAVTGNANTRMKATAPAAGTEQVATRISAIRIGDE